ncbi:killer cell lectin-like receptor 2 isoform X1 [Arvicola amphibius]|uniref:killer cell lectin-like receptor 2 isoform X1 n=1 Tax=Arvicola amphibius TaxID=1047088 RepID=UPI0018E397C6|nr:killer cell lectin-like receptor 2 isoform X1 [Arvicola amphibius]XP_038175424.1 killer cell lectin-like receptor 2 isoform X1 [Arvicola amphibius]
MTDEEITYATVRFHKSSSGLQKEGKSDETQGPRKAGHKECSVPWHLIAIPVGILCSILLVALAVLVTYIFQYKQEKHELQKTLNNIDQEYRTMKYNYYLWKEMLRNKSVEYDALKDHLNSLERKQNICYGEAKLVLDCEQRTGKPFKGHWFCCGIKCYYFIMDKKKWRGCNQTCQDCRLSLLKIDDDDELKFLQLQINQNNYWIGLSYNEKGKKWQWIDNGPSNLDSKIANFSRKTRRCAFLSRTRLENTKCESFYSCICEMRMDKDPDSPSSKS